MIPLLKIQDLLVQRGKRITLEIEQLTIEKGETVAIAGPNGAGKSTLLLVLARLLKPQRGKIFFNGEPAEAMDDLTYRRKIGLVMQEALVLNQSVQENISLGLRFRHLPSEEINLRMNEWMERLGISHLRLRPATQLSGGEARRVALARAFVLQPDLLLLDEPFSALDRASRHRLQDDLKGILNGANTTTVFSTHSDTDIQKLADRKIFLDGGKPAGDI